VKQTISEAECMQRIHILEKIMPETEDESAVIGRMLSELRQQLEEIRLAEGAQRQREAKRDKYARILFKVIPWIGLFLIVFLLALRPDHSKVTTVIAFFVFLACLPVCLGEALTAPKKIQKVFLYIFLLLVGPLLNKILILSTGFDLNEWMKGSGLEIWVTLVSILTTVTS